MKELSRAGRILRKVFEGKGSDVSKFKESNEMAPMAYKWDYDKSKLKLGLKGKVGLDKYYVKLPIHPTSRLERLDVEVWASKVEQRYLIGFWETDSDFRIMCELKGSVYKDVEPHGYINPIQTNEVKTESRMRAEGFASTMYLSLIRNGYTLVSDYSQFDGARNLWKSLHKYQVHIDVYDEIDEAITKGHQIISTDFDNLDKEWSRFHMNERSKEHLLFVATDGR